MPKAKPLDVTTLSDVALVELALEKWDGPVEYFADKVVGVHPTSLLRWRKGGRLLPRRRRWFEQYVDPTVNLRWRNKA